MTENTENGKNKEKKETEKQKMGRKQKMLKELVSNPIQPPMDESNKNPVRQALDQFSKENGYEFLEMINNEKIRRKHLFKQLQKDDYDDNEFLDRFYGHQGE